MLNVAVQERPEVVAKARENRRKSVLNEVGFSDTHGRAISTHPNMDRSLARMSLACLPSMARISEDVEESLASRRQAFIGPSRDVPAAESSKEAEKRQTEKRDHIKETLRLLTMNGREQPQPCPDSAIEPQPKSSPLLQYTGMSERSSIRNLASASPYAYRASYNAAHSSSLSGHAFDRRRPHSQSFGPSALPSASSGKGKERCTVAPKSDLPALQTSVLTPKSDVQLGAGELSPTSPKTSSDGRKTPSPLLAASHPASVDVSRTSGASSEFTSTACTSATEVSERAASWSPNSPKMSSEQRDGDDESDGKEGEEVVHKHAATGKDVEQSSTEPWLGWTGFV